MRPGGPCAGVPSWPVLAWKEGQQFLDCGVNRIGARDNMVEMEGSGGKAGMPEEALHLLKRVAEQSSVAFGRSPDAIGEAPRS
jgi:hypothetical protein